MGIPPENPAQCNEFTVPKGPMAMPRKNIRSPISLSAPVIAAMVGRSPRTVRHWFFTGELECKAGKSEGGQPCMVATMAQLKAFCQKKDIVISEVQQ